jgi:PAS domain-containing protein
MEKSNEVRVLTRRIGLLEKTLAEMVDINHANTLQKKIHSHPEKTIAKFNNDYERSKRQHPLPSKENEMLALFNNIDSGIAFKQLVYNEDGIPIDYIIFDVNPQFEKILCLDRESVVGQLASEIYLSNPLPYLDHYIRAVQTGKTVNFKTYYMPTGKNLQVSVIPLRGKRFATIFQDISNDQTLQA